MKKAFKKSLAVLLLVFMLFSIFSITVVNAATISKTGSCGSNVTYTIYSDGTLKISGTGVMTNYSSSSSIPWHSYRESITNVVIESGVTTIGKYAFYNCDSLTNIIIPNSVISIGEDAFYKCVSLTSITIPNSVKSIGRYAFNQCRSLESITIPNSITTIESGLFYWCTSLKRVKIPDSVTSIGVYAFDYCYSLTGIYIPDSVTSIGQGAFTGSGLTSVTIPKNITTISSELFNWCTDLATVNFSDRVTSIGNGAFFSCRALTHITIPDNVTKIGADAFARSGLTNITIPDSITSIGENAFLDCLAINTVYIKSMSAWHNIKFENKYSNPLYYAKNINVSSEQLNFVDKTSVSSGNDASDPIPIEIELASDFEISVPSDVPFIGGTNVKIDTSLVPVSASFKDNKLRVGIGCTDITNVEDDTWCDYKNYIKGYEKKIKKGSDLLDVLSKYGGLVCNYGFDKDFKIDIYGYYEAVYNNGQVIEKAGLVNIQVSGEAGKEWQTVVMSFPVVLKVKGEANADIDLSLRCDTVNSKMYFDGDYEITLPKIRASVGLGVAYIADISVYGQAENKINVYSNPDYTTGTLKGEIGVSGKFLMFSGSIPILKSKDGWVYYDSRKKTLNSTGSDMLTQDLSKLKYSINRSYLADQSYWLQGATPLMTTFSLATAEETATDYTALQTSVYNGATPKIVKTDTTTMMVWTADISERTDGNHTAIVYSNYDESTGLWSEPVILDDDGTADFYADITTDGSDIYVTWVDTNTTFDADVDITTMAAACEINVAKYSAEKDGFTDIQTITNNSTVDINPAITINNGNPVVVWKNNSDNSIISFSGTDTLYYAEISSDGTYTVNQAVSSANAIYSLATDGKNIAYSADTDGDINTQTDIEIFAGAIGTTPIQLTANETNEANLRVSNINGTTYFTYLSNGVIYGTTDMSTITQLTDESAQVAGEYEFISSGDITKLIVTESNGTASNLFSWSKNSNGYWSNPVQLTNSDAYIRGADAVIDSNGDLQFVYLLTSAEIGEETVTESSNLCTQIITDKHDITLNSVDYASEDVIESGNLTVTANLSNTGTYDETDLLVEVTDEDGNSVLSTTVDTTIASGETADVEFAVPLPEVIIEKYNYTVSITPASSDDINTADNSSVLEFGYANLQLSTDIIADGDNAGVLLSVNNNTCVPTIGSLVIKDGNADGAILDEYYLGSIDANTSLSYLLDKSMVAKYKLVTENIYLEITSFKDEVAIADNTDFAYVANIDTSILADINCDGDITITDVTLLQKYLAKFETLNEQQLAVVDVNGDEKVNIRDVTIIQMYLARIIEAFSDVT